MVVVPADFPERPGMRFIIDKTVYRVGDDLYLRDSDNEGPNPDMPKLPDFDDPATLGALLGAVREAYPFWFAISCQYRGSVEAWHVVARRKDYRDRNDHAILGEGATEADALLSAWAKRPTVPR